MLDGLRIIVGSISLPTTMTTEVKFPFDELPVELQREIFLFAANDDHGKAIRLLLVARHIHAW